MAQPPVKRLRMTVSVGGGNEAAAAAVPESPGSRKLWQTLLVMLFLVRVSVRNKVTPSLSQIGRMVQRHVDRIFRKYHGAISSNLESFQGQIEGRIEGLHQEVKQLARLCSNRQADQYTRLEPNHEHASANGSNTNIRLRFLNDPKTPIYTHKNITAENNAAIKIGMFEGDKMIKSGPLSKVKVEILVLRGDFFNDGQDNWTEEDFNKYIVQGRNGQGFVLGGDCTVWLNNGQATISQIRFKEGSSRTRSRKFIMGARVCNSEKTSVRVQEAVMKPVKVLDRRNEANEKRHPPMLDDDVYRLEEIAKDGAYRKRLQKAHIITVKDFLKALNKDANKLREILQMKRQHNSWKKMVRHARECFLEDRQELKPYQNEEGNVVLFFNCVHDLVGGEFHGNYITYGEFDPAQKAVANKLKDGTGAYDKLEDTSFDYVMKGKFPEPISSSKNAAAGPSIVVPGTSQPNPAGHLAANQGTATAENSSRGGINQVNGPFYPTANYDHSTSIPDSLNTHDYQDQGTPPIGQQQISTLPDWQQNPGPIYEANYEANEALVEQWSKVAYEHMTFDQFDYEMDNGQARLTDRGTFQGSTLRSNFTGLLQGHTDQEIFAESNFQSDQQGASVSNGVSVGSEFSGSNSQHCTLKRVGSVLVRQFTSVHENNADASLDISVHLESGSGTQYPTTANDTAGSLTLHCPGTISNEIAGSVAVDQEALPMGHGAYEMSFANRDTPVSPWFQQEQPLPAQHDAPSCPLNAAADTCVLSRDSSFRPSNFLEMLEHWEQNQMSEDWFGDSVDTFFSAPNANGLPADVHCNVAKLLSHRKWIKLVALVRWLSMLRASSRSREEHA